MDRIGDLVEETLAKMLPPPLNEEFFKLQEEHRATQEEITKRAIDAYIREIEMRVDRLTFFGDITPEDARKIASEEAKPFKAGIDQEVRELLAHHKAEFDRKVAQLFEEADGMRSEE